MKVICPRDILGRCVDKSCSYQHLPPSKPTPSYAAQVVDRFKDFFADAVWKAFEKDIIGTKLNLYSGKQIDSTVNTLIHSLCLSPTKAPIRRIR